MEKWGKKPAFKSICQGIATKHWQKGQKNVLNGICTEMLDVKGRGKKNPM